MMQEHNKFRLPDQNKKNDLQVEVNWATHDDKSNFSKLLRFILPNGETAVVKKEHLMEVLFAIGTPEEQADMIPKTITRVRAYETTVGVKATKDIAKGEMINFPIKLDIPYAEDEIIGPHV